MTPVSGIGRTKITAAVRRVSMDLSEEIKLMAAHPIGVIMIALAGSLSA